MTTGIGFEFTASGEVGEGTALQNQRCICSHIRAHHDQQCLVDSCACFPGVAYYPEEEEQP